MSKVDTKALDEFTKKLQGAEKSIQKEVVEKSLNELTSRVLAQTIRQTPRDTGRLARSWKSKEGVTRKGNRYSKDIYNDTEYSVYVEYGHRTRNHKGWVPGQFMLTNAVNDISKRADSIVSSVVNSYMGKLFND